ncbi:MAG: HDOD domain-containing protein [Mariprofundaceae bacterium]
MPLQTMDRESSLELIRMVDNLPSLPDRYTRIREVIDDPESGAAELAHIIGSDQATTAMVLKFANSQMHNPMGNNIVSLEMAVARLGMRETAQIGMAMSLIYGFAIPAGMGHVRALWTHAFAVALLAKKMAALLGCDQDVLFITGLLHDIGRAILGIRVDMDYFESSLANMYGEELIIAEQAAFGLDHAEAGAELLKLWGLPADVYETVGAHHCKEPSSVAVHIVQLASDEAHQSIPFGTNFDNVEELLFADPERPRQLLEDAGLIDVNERDARTA